MVAWLRVTDQGKPGQGSASTVTGQGHRMDTLSIDAPATRPGRAVADGRQAARNFLGALRPAVGPDAADGVVLIASELVTDAVRHGDGTYALRLSARPGSIEVAW